MATWTVGGFEEYFARLGELQQSAEPIMKAATYKGAALAADEIRKEIEKLPAHQSGSPGGVTNFERDALLTGLGISPMQFDDDFLNAKIGFDGYYDDGKHPGKNGKGKPIVVVARSVESGTSFSQKQPFMRRATRRIKGKVIDTMSDELNKQCSRIFK